VRVGCSLSRTACEHAAVEGGRREPRSVADPFAVPLGQWYVGTMDRNRAALAIEDFLRALGRDPARFAEHQDTGKLVADAFIDEFCAGYAVDVDALLNKERIALEGAPALIVVRDIHVRTICPHHLMVATGKATLALLPNASIVGLGAYVELVRAFANRLTLQEDLGTAIVQTLHRVLAPTYVGCKIHLTHGCLSERGEEAHGTQVETLHAVGIDPLMLATVFDA
jgi:GTP cyclohydrolase IA